LPIPPNGFGFGSHQRNVIGTDLAHGPTLGVQVGCTLNVHRDTVTSFSRIGFHQIKMLGQGYRTELARSESFPLHCLSPVAGTIRPIVYTLLPT
jgi:hypothetical protein